jgi:hypothetical protein
VGHAAEYLTRIIFSFFSLIVCPYIIPFLQLPMLTKINKLSFLLQGNCIICRQTLHSPLDTVNKATAVHHALRIVLGQLLESFTHPCCQYQSLHSSSKIKSIKPCYTLIIPPLLNPNRFKKSNLMLR